MPMPWIRRPATSSGISSETAKVKKAIPMTAQVASIKFFLFKLLMAGPEIGRIARAVTANMLLMTPTITGSPPKNVAYCGISRFTMF